MRSTGDPGQAYHVGWRVLDTAEHGVRQHRERICILGIRKAVDVPGSWTWPMLNRHISVAELMERKGDVSLPSGKRTP